MDYQSKKQYLKRASARYKLCKKVEINHSSSMSLEKIRLSIFS